MKLCQPREEYGGQPLVRLIRSSWIEKRAKALLKARSEDEKWALALPTRQQLEESEPSAFMSFDELFLGKGRRKKNFLDPVRIDPWIVAVSYCHLTERHPDPLGQHVLRYAELVENERARPGSTFPMGEYGIFVGWCSLYQPDPATGAFASDDFAASNTLAVREGGDVLFAHKLVRLVILDAPVGSRGTGGEAVRRADERAWPTFELAINSLARAALHHGRGAGVLFSGPSSALVRAPPVQTSKRFARQLEATAFGRQSAAQRELVLELYSSAFDTILSGCVELQCAGLGWGDEECEALAEVLPMCTMCRSINLARNARIGDRGVVAIAKALATGAAPRVREVNLQQVHIGTEATLALRHVVRVRDVNWFV